MTAKTIWILRGSTTVPSHRPSDAVSVEAKTMTTMSRNQLVTWMCGPWPGRVHPVHDGEDDRRADERLDRARR